MQIDNLVEYSSDVCTDSLSMSDEQSLLVKVCQRKVTLNYNFFVDMELSIWIRELKKHCVDHCKQVHQKAFQVRSTGFAVLGFWNGKRWGRISWTCNTGVTQLLNSCILSISPLQSSAFARSTAIVDATEKQLSSIYIIWARCFQSEEYSWRVLNSYLTSNYLVWFDTKIPIPKKSKLKKTPGKLTRAKTPKIETTIRNKAKNGTRRAQIPRKRLDPPISWIVTQSLIYITYFLSNS